MDDVVYATGWPLDLSKAFQETDVTRPMIAFREGTSSKRTTLLIAPGKKLDRDSLETDELSLLQQIELKLEATAPRHGHAEPEQVALYNHWQAASDPNEKIVPYVIEGLGTLSWMRIEGSNDVLFRLQGENCLDSSEIFISSVSETPLDMAPLAVAFQAGTESLPGLGKRGQIGSRRVFCLGGLLQA